MFYFDSILYKIQYNKPTYLLFIFGFWQQIPCIHTKLTCFIIFPLTTLNAMCITMEPIPYRNGFPPNPKTTINTIKNIIIADPLSSKSLFPTQVFDPLAIQWHFGHHAL